MLFDVTWRLEGLTPLRWFRCLPLSGNPCKTDTASASTFAAAQTAIIMAAGTSYLFDTVRSRLCMFFAVNMAFGGLAAAGNFTTVYPLDYARITPERTSLGMLARRFVRLHEKDGYRHQGLLIHLWKNDTSFASTFAAARTAIIMGAGTSFFCNNVRRRPQMQTGKPMALGTSSAMRRGRRHDGDCQSHASVPWSPMREALY